MEWELFAGDTVVGTVLVCHDVEPLGRAIPPRDLYLYVPPSHGSGQRFPLVVMHDGLNLFDDVTSNNGEWRVDETMEQLAGEGIEALVVGVPHGPDRLGEYAGPLAEAYLAFLVDVVLPLVRTDFDADPRREATGLAGSSLGGVISLHGLYAYPRVFGSAGVFSPAFFVADGHYFDLVERGPKLDARIYLDVGGREDEDEGRRQAYLDGFHRLGAILSRKGYGDDDLMAILDDDGVHHESAWARRLPDALRFLLAPRA